jgi:dihydroorotase
MKPSTSAVLLKGAHVIDPGQGIDGIRDIALENGKICSLEGLPPNVETIDLTGSYLTPGWIDIHVHVYGTLGFADPDSIGVCQGVTSYVEAGGPGIGTLDEFLALLDGQTKTTLYAGPYIRPLGILGLNFIESDVRTLTNIPIADWLDFKKAHPGLLRYIKVGAFSGYGYGPTKLGKGLAEILDLPLYAHIGEHQLQPGNESAYEIYRVSEAGDIVTHIYHGNECGILDKDGKILPVVQEAKNRGVLFDVGFGGFNFSWRVAERAWAQNFFPDIISSDLQQFNVAGPAYSLANLMTCFMKLGMSLNDAIEKVTSAPAKALRMTDIAGSLRPGLPADITVFRVDSGSFTLTDTTNHTRPYDKKIVPTMAFKNGERVDCDMERCQDEKNWLIQIAEDHEPEGMKRLTAAQKLFLGALAGRLAPIQWDEFSVQTLDYDKSLALQAAFHQARREQDIPLRDALVAVFDLFLDHRFTMQIGLFLLRLDRNFALDRMRKVASAQRMVA